MLENHGSAEVSLRQELEFMVPYLEIEQTRLGHALNVVWQIDPGSLEGRVPHLILQPLVDDVVARRAGGSPGGGIRVSASRAGQWMRLQIGVDGDDVPAAGAVWTPDTISHVDARLERLYNGSHELALTYPPRGSATVVMTFPFRAQATLAD